MAEGFKTGNPFVDAWSQAFVRGSEEMGAKPSAGMDWPLAMREAEDNWRLCERQASDWMKAVGRQIMPASGSDSAEGIAEETLRRMLDPTQFFVAGTDEVNQAIQRLVEGPEFTDFGTLERQVLKATGEWIALRQASMAFKAVTAAAWSRAFATFTQATTAEPSLMSQGPRAVLDRWLKIANEELIRTQRTEAFLKAQRELLTAGVNYRLKERALVEVWCETHSIPTRTEIDDVHRTLHDLRAQVRDLKSRLMAAEAQPARPTPRRKTTTRKSA
jgi:polyhydroxyalkanoate synthase subunit PhaE